MRRYMCCSALGTKLMPIQYIKRESYVPGLEGLGLLEREMNSVLFP
jgi:hypothetical protein